MSGSVRIPISADAGGVRQALEEMQRAIDSVAKDAKTFAEIDLSHPELRELAHEIRQVEANLNDMRRVARGETAAAVRAVYDGSGINLFGPGGALSAGLAARYPDPAQHNRVLGQAANYILAGTRWAPPPPAPATPPAPAPGGQGQQQGQQPMTAGQTMRQAAARAAGYMGGGIMSGAAFGLGLLGVRTIGGLAAQAYGGAREEASNTDVLMRTLRDTTQTFSSLRDAVAATTSGLWITNQEMGRLAISWGRLTNETNAGRALSGIQLATGMARGYGISPEAMTAVLGRAEYLGQDPRQFALLIGEAVRESGQTGQVENVMKALLSWSESASRLLVTHTNVADFAAMYAGLNATGLPGLKGQNAIALISQISNSIMQGGSAGLASMALAYRAFATHGITDPYQVQYQLQGGAFERVPGTHMTNFDLLRGEVNREYDVLPGAETPGTTNYCRRLSALAGEFGINMRQAQALDKFKPGDMSRTQEMLSRFGMSLEKLNPTAIGEIAEMAGARADLQGERRKLLGRDDLSTAERAELQHASGEDLREVIVRILATHGTQQDAATKLAQSMADLNNALTRLGHDLVPPVTTIANLLSDLIEFLTPGKINPGQPSGPGSTEIGTALPWIGSVRKFLGIPAGGYGGGGGGDTTPAPVRRVGSLPAGEQANNPLNLMYAHQVGARPMPLNAGHTLAAFPDVIHGIAADYRQLLLDQSRGFTTVRDLVNRWDTDPGDDKTKYIAGVAAAIGVGPDDRVDMHQSTVAAAYLKAAAKYETGMKLSDADVQAGINLATNKSAPAPAMGTRTPLPQQPQVNLGSLQFQPLRVVHENAAGDQLGEEYLPSTFVPAPIPLGYEPN